MPVLPASSPTQTRAPATAWAFALAWLAGFGVLQWSVVQYRVPIVATLTACCAALVVWQWRRTSVQLGPWPVALMLLGAAVVTLRVPLFSYLTPDGLLVATGAVVSACVVAGLLLGQGRSRASLAALGAAVVGYLVAGVAAIRTDPAPRIDVWVTLQQASDWLARGVSFYEVTWVGSPGMKDNFTYLPWTTVLLAPGRWLAGDVRWALLAWTLVAAVGVWLLAAGPVARARSEAGRWPSSSAWRGAAAIALLLLAPGTLTQLDQAWTEPLLLAGLVWWAVLVDRGRAWWAVVPLALACASKQHLALLLPILLVWRPFGVRRTLATGALTGLLVLPWVLAGPRDFLDDTVGVLVTFPPIRFANTLYLFAQHTLGVTPPFWATGLVVLGCLAAIVLVVRRRQPGTAELLRWLALMLLVANLMNKQAFYNQYWLVGSLLVASLALAPVRPIGGVGSLAPDIPASTRERVPWQRSESPAPSGGGAAPSAAT